MPFLISLDDRHEHQRLADGGSPSQGRTRTDPTALTLERLRACRDLARRRVPTENVLRPTEGFGFRKSGPSEGTMFPVVPDLEDPIYAVPDLCSFLQVTHQLRHRERMVYSSVLHYWSLLALPATADPEEKRRIVDLDATKPVLTTFGFRREPESPWLLPVIETSEPLALNLGTFDGAIRNGLARLALKPYGTEDPVAVASVVNGMADMALPRRPEERTEWIADIEGAAGTVARRCVLTGEDVGAVVREAWRLANLDGALPGEASLLVVTRWAPWLQGPDTAIRAPDHRAFILKFRELQALGLPLYLKKLDLIEFRVRSGREVLTINICSPTPVREGERLTFEAKTSTGQRLFAMDDSIAYFPIFINGIQDTIGELPAVLMLHAPDEGRATVSIRFHVTVGQRLRIEVIDESTRRLIRHELVAQAKVLAPGVKCLPWSEIVSVRGSRNQKAHERFILSGAFREVQRAAGTIERVLREPAPDRVPAAEARAMLGRLHGPLQVLNVTLRLPGSTTSSSADDLLLGYTVPTADLEQSWDREIKDALLSARGLQMLASWLPVFQRSFSPVKERWLINQAVTQLGRLYGAGALAGVFPHVLPSVDDMWDDFAKDQILMAKARLSTRVEDQIALLSSLRGSLPTPQASTHAWAVSRVLLWHCRFKEMVSSVDAVDLALGLAELGQEIRSKNAKETFFAKQNVFLGLIFLLSFAEADAGFAVEGSAEREAIVNLLESYRYHSPIRLRQVDPSTSLSEILKDLVENKDLGQGIMARLLRLA